MIKKKKNAAEIIYFLIDKIEWQFLPIFPHNLLSTSQRNNRQLSWR